MGSLMFSLPNRPRSSSTMLLSSLINKGSGLRNLLPGSSSLFSHFSTALVEHHLEGKDVNRAL